MTGRCHRNSHQLVVMRWGRRPCQWSLVWRLFPKSKNLASQVLLILEKAPWLLQVLGLTHLDNQAEYLLNITTSILQLLSYEITATFMRYFTCCTFHRILDASEEAFVCVSIRCKSYRIADCIPNIERVHKLAEVHDSGCWKLWPEAFNDFQGFHNQQD